MSKKPGSTPRQGTTAPSAFSGTTEALFQRGARGYMQWGLMAGSNNNDGDKDRGMDHVLETDWDGLFNALKDRAGRLEQELV